MPKRWLEPTFFTDEKLAKATIPERQLFAALIANQDDDGRLLGHPGYLRSIAFPYDELSIDEVKQMRDHLAEVNHNVVIYQNSGDEYIFLRKHERYQNPRYYHPSKFPPPPGEISNPTATKQPPDSTQKITEQLPQGDQTTTKEQPSGDQEVALGRVGLGGVGQDLGKRDIPTVYPAALNTAPDEKPPKTTRQKQKQADAGIFLDLVEQHIGTKLVQRPRHIGQIRPLLVKFSEVTPESLLDCFKWLKQHDPYCQARDSPMVISMLPSKYPEWAAGKLPAGSQPRGSPKLPTADELKSRTRKFMKGEP